MARKSLTVTITDPGRDLGKTFLLREMPAKQAEKWALKALLALSHADVDVPEEILTSGMAGIASFGIKALGKLNFYDAEPLLDEMFAFVSCIPDPVRPEVVRALIDDDIEEVKTRLQLRKDLLMLHINFSTAANP